MDRYYRTEKSIYDKLINKNTITCTSTLIISYFTYKLY